MSPSPPHSLKCREICWDCSGKAHFRNSCSQSGPEKVSCSLLLASFAAFFSGGIRAVRFQRIHEANAMRSQTDDTAKVA
jgi:hypothetical protein